MCIRDRIDVYLTVPFWVVFVVFVCWTLIEMLVAVIVEKFEISEQQRLMLQRKVYEIDKKPTLPNGRQAAAEAEEAAQNSAGESELATLFLMVHQHTKDDIEVDAAPSSQKIKNMFALDRITSYLRQRGNSVPATIAKRWTYRQLGTEVEAAFYDWCLRFRIHARRQAALEKDIEQSLYVFCLLYTSPSPRDRTRSRMPSSA
eukprot:TRINITY_DN47271_c0_g1_i1.p1 TRINITY_DN47271_c0_g1~~TRINITY_DN47271_c0_g1_i1.p1  ORF type:complete len:202 (+),score=68.87 TRINITY_DN47271_c0_g1_i1:150-755(+)